jgi:hypothetical protein
MPQRFVSYLHPATSATLPALTRNFGRLRYGSIRRVDLGGVEAVEVLVELVFDLLDTVEFNLSV